MKVKVMTARSGGDFDVYLAGTMVASMTMGEPTFPEGWANLTTEEGLKQMNDGREARYELCKKLTLVKEQNGAGRKAPHWASNFMGTWEGELPEDDQHVQFFANLVRS